MQPSGKAIKMFNIEKPKSNYMILEIIRAEHSQYNSVYVICSDNKATLTIVRCSE